MRRDDLASLFQPTDDPVDGIHEVLFLDNLLVFPGGDQGRFIAHVGDVGTGKAGSLTGQEIDIHLRIQFQRLQVNLENGLPLPQVWEFNVDLAVEPASPHQGAVQDIGPVGGRQDDHTGVGGKAVHLSQELVQGVLPFIVGAGDLVPATGTTNSIDLIDEDDARGLLFRLTKEITNAGSADTDKHLHEIGSGDREERNLCFTCNRFGQQGFTSTRRSYKQSSLRDLAAELGVFTRILQKVDNLHYLHFGLFKAGHIVEGYVHTGIFVKKLRLRFPDVEDLSAGTSATTAHETHDQKPCSNQDRNRDDVTQDIAKYILAGVIGGRVGVLFLEFVQLIDWYIRSYHSCNQGVAGILQEHIKDIFRPDLIEKLGILRGRTPKSLLVELLVGGIGQYFFFLDVDLCLLFIDHNDLLNILLLKHLFQAGPGGLFDRTGVVKILDCNEDDSQDRVDPVKAEFGFSLLPRS